MREARWAASQKPASGAAATRTSRAATRPTPKADPQPSTAAASPIAEAPAATEAAATEAAPCGHRSMNGRTCTRPAGHAEKNHRYG